MARSSEHRAYERAYATGRALRDALAFLTIVPLAPDDEPQPGYLRRAMATFPAVGAAIGGAAALVLIVADACGLPSAVAALLAVAATAILAGGLHEDGLADFADGLAGGRDRKTRLAIMADSRIGGAGALALVFSVGLRTAAIAALPAATAAAALVAAGAVSRAALVGIARWVVPARTSGLAAAAGRPGGLTIPIAAVIAVGIAVVALGPGRGGLALVAAALVTLAIARLALAKLGGHTGDVFGAAQQVAETAVLIMAAAS